MEYENYALLCQSLVNLLGLGQGTKHIKTQIKYMHVRGGGKILIKLVESYHQINEEWGPPKCFKGSVKNVPKLIRPHCDKHRAYRCPLGWSVQGAVIIVGSLDSIE